MTNELLFALNLVTLVVLCVVIWARLRLVEAHLASQREGLDRLLEWLERWAGQSRQVDLSRVEEQLASSGTVLRRIHDAIARLQLPAGEQPARGGDLADLVERKLYGLGYRSVIVVTDISDADPEATNKVVLEAEKDGVTYKGSLVVQGGSVVELDLQPVFTSFP